MGKLSCFKLNYVVMMRIADNIEGTRKKVFAVFKFNKSLRSKKD